MKKPVAIVLRVLIGLFFIVAGLDGFLEFLPPFPMSDRASVFVNAMIDSGFLWQFVKATQLMAGVLLSIDLFVPFALAVLAPVIAVIFCMDLFINPSGLPIALSLVAMELVLVWFYQDYFRAILVSKAILE